MEVIEIILIPIVTVMIMVWAILFYGATKRDNEHCNNTSKVKDFDKRITRIEQKLGIVPESDDPIGDE